MRHHTYSSLLVVAFLVTACTDNMPVTSDNGWPDPTTLDEVAYAVAVGLASDEARADILEAMRASSKVQHALLLADHLGSIKGGRLLRDGALALGVSEDEFHGSVLALPSLEVVVPVREHRLNWTGSARIGVAGSWDSDPSIGDLAADGGCTGPSCDDDDHRPGSGSNGDWGDANTFARHWSARCSLVGEGLGDSSEVEIWLEMDTGKSIQSGHFRLEGLECPETAHWVGFTWPDPGRHLATFSKIPRGRRISYIVIETDSLFDDELGSALVEPKHNMNNPGYDPTKHSFSWWDLALQLPYMTAQISW